VARAGRGQVRSGSGQCSAGQVRSGSGQVLVKSADHLLLRGVVRRGIKVEPPVRFIDLDLLDDEEEEGACIFVFVFSHEKRRRF
jgi:hypothetical protein